MEQDDDTNNIRGRISCVGCLAKMEMMHLSSNTLTSAAIDSIGDLYAIMSGLEVYGKKHEQEQKNKDSEDEESKMLKDMNVRLQKSDTSGDTATWISRVVVDQQNQNDADVDGTDKKSEEKKEEEEEEEELKNETKKRENDSSSSNNTLHPIISNSIRSRIRNEIMLYVRAGKPGEALLKLIPDPSVDASPLRQSAVAIVMEAISEPLNLYGKSLQIDIVTIAMELLGPSILHLLCWERANHDRISKNVDDGVVIMTSTSKLNAALRQAAFLVVSRTCTSKFLSTCSALGAARGNERVSLKLMEKAWHAANTPVSMPVRISNELRNVRKLYETCCQVLEVSEKMLGRASKILRVPRKLISEWSETSIW